MLAGQRAICPKSMLLAPKTVSFRVSRASAHATWRRFAVVAGDLDDEALRKAIDTQLQRSRSTGSVTARTGPPTSQSAGAVPAAKPLKAKNDSVEVLKGMKEKVPIISPQDESKALERQLSFGSGGATAASGSSVPEALKPAAPATQPAVLEPAVASASNGAAAEPTAAPSKAGKYAPCHTFEDGSIMFTAEALVQVDYEDVLAP